MSVQANTDAMMRSADLNWAYQCGREAAQGDMTAEPEFAQRCAGDDEALREFQRGFVSQEKRQSAPERADSQALSKPPGSRRGRSRG